jgi:murein DD-endopeptidase MepM/ murein hydrolase activator NlpD
VDVRSRALVPGELLDIRIRAATPLTSVVATLDERTLPAWRLPSGDWRVLAGIDVDQPPGSLPLAVTATPADGAPLTHTATLDVGPGTFVERHLKVAPRYVEPPASQRARIQEERVRLQAIYGRVTPELHPGAFVAPVRHRRSSPFGARSVFNGEPRAPHAGLDFASPAGAKIRAPAAGRVVLVDDLYFTGRTVVLDHGQGLYSILAHMQRTLVREGLEVARGAPLGLVGATGRATGPHLHWSVRLGGARVDPAALLELLEPPQAGP